MYLAALLLSSFLVSHSHTFCSSLQHSAALLQNIKFLKLQRTYFPFSEMISKVLTTC